MKNIVFTLLILLSRFAAIGQCSPGVIRGDSTVRVSDTMTLNDTAMGGRWSSSDTTIAVVNPGTGLVRGLSRGKAIITYTMSGPCTGYFAIDTIKVTSGFIGHNKICIHDTTRLKDTLASGTWTSSDTLIAAINDTNGLITARDTGSVVITYSFSRAGTAYLATDTVRVRTIPTSIGTVTGTLALCALGSTTLIDTFDTMVWSSLNISIARVTYSGHDTAVVSCPGAGSTLIKYAPYYCTLSWDTVRLVINPNPNPGTITGGDIGLCPGGYITLGISGADSGYSYWDGSYGSLAGVTSAGVVSESSYAHLYAPYWLPFYHSVLNTFGCESSTETYIEINPNAWAYFTSAPGTVHLGTTASYAVSGYWPTGSWSVSSATIATISTTGVVTGLSVGTANITFSSASICDTSISVTTVNVLPPVIGAVSYEFSSFINRLCASPQFGVSLPPHTSTYHLKTSYGDGMNDTTAISASGTTALTTFTHTYNNSGMYSIKQVLYNGSTALDSVMYSYEHFLCRDMAISLYVDNNDNCQYDTATDHFNTFPVFIEVDSNSVPLDTFSVTSGLYYSAWGSSGDIYSFKIFGVDSPLHFSCPSSGIVYDTLIGSGLGTANKSVALQCTSSAGFDLAESTYLLTGRHKADGSIAISNNHCTTENPVVTLHISPKYVLDYEWTYPHPTTIVGNTVTWDFTGVSASSVPPFIAYTLVIPDTTWLTPGDTVHTYITVAPIIGDLDTNNNNIIRVDTVKSSFDPNHIAVSPEGEILNGTKLHYTVAFENDGNDTAQNIYLMDTLSDSEDPRTLQLVAASATMNIAILHSGGHTIAKFDFPNIKLLDSSYHNQCTGFVMYTIKARTGLADGTVIPAHAGIYFDDNPVVLTDTSFNTILIPHLTVTATHTDTICPGDTVHYTATPATVNITHYQWLVNGAAAGSDSVGFTLAGATFADTVSCRMATIMDDTVYSFSNRVALLNRGYPRIGIISGPSVVCPGASITLSETVGAGAWSVSNGHASIAAGSVHGISAGTDTVYYSLTNLCGTAAANYVVTINPLPFAGTITGPSSVCIGSTITVSDSATGGTWSVSNSHLSHSGGVLTGVTFGPDSVVYSVTNYCGTALAVKSVAVNPLVTPSVSFTTTADTVCAGDTVTFTPAPVNGGAAPAYIWNRFSTGIGSGAPFRYVPANGDVIKCTMVSDAICPSPDTVVSTAVTLVVNPTVTPVNTISTAMGDSISYLGQIVTFNAEITYCGSAPTYQWYLDGVPVSGATGVSYSTTVFNNDTIYCVNTCNTPCATQLTDTSNTLVIYANYLTTEGTNILQTKYSNLSLYPNPNTGNFTISSKSDHSANNVVDFDVQDITGKVIYSGKLSPQNKQINEKVSLPNVAPGQYILRAITGNTVEFVQFTVFER